MRRPPPHLNVTRLAKARAPEVEAFYAVIKKSIRKRNRQNDSDAVQEPQEFAMPRNQRRRTTSHINRKANLWRKRKRDALKRSTRFKIKAAEDHEETNKVKKLSRRVRRKIELKGGNDGGFGCSRDGTKRLVTHVWHAKRFTMTKKWGFYLPLGLFGRGRGSRAVLKWSKSSALLHDASYYGAVQLEGPEDSLLKVLRKVLEPSPPLVESMSEMSRAELYGLCYGTAMLHKVGELPCGSIAPVTYLWCPSAPGTSKVAVGRDMKDSDASNDKEKEQNNQTRYLWTWIHAAAFDKAFDALQYACHRQSAEDGVQLVCLSRQQDLGRIDLLGSRALELLQKILHPISRLHNSDEGYKFESPLESLGRSASNIFQLRKAYHLANANKLSTNAVFSMEVYDPRDTPAMQDKYLSKVSSGTKDDHPQVFPKVESDVTNEFPDSKIQGMSGNEEIPSMSDDRFSFAASKEESQKAFDTFSTYVHNKKLWSAKSEGLSLGPPLSENLLNKKRHLQRLAFFYLDEEEHGDETLERDEEGFSRSCPIILLKNDDKKPSACGWSIIIPISWVRVFWIPLVLGGARAIGLRERRWLSCDAGLPSFPYDFPDCKAYWDHMHEEMAAYEEMIACRPPSKRPPSILLPPQWHSIQRSILRGCNGRAHLPVEITEAESGKSGSVNRIRFGLENFLQNQLETSEIKREELGSHNFSSIQLADYCFPGFIARTSNILKQHLRRVGGLHLLLFPETPGSERKTCFRLMDEGRIRWNMKGANNIILERKPCFLRVLLYAAGKGVFEDGAIVCAPMENDFTFWSSRCCGWRGLEIPPTLRNAECIQQGMSNNETMQSADMASKFGHENLRRPIGFVTTGVCRGSVPALAVAMCEGTILGQLRAEQWRDTKWKKKSEIFVCVRNMKSTVYRPALAAIVLEELEDKTYR